MWICNCPATFVGMTILSSLSCLRTFVENQRTIDIWFYFWAQFSPIDLYVYTYASTTQSFFFNFLKIYLFYLFLAVLGLRCRAWAFSSCSEQGLLFVVVHRLLICGGFSCCGAWAIGV